MPPPRAKLKTGRTGMHLESVLIFRKRCEKHDRKEAVQKILYMQTNPEKSFLWGNLK